MCQQYRNSIFPRGKGVGSSCGVSVLCPVTGRAEQVPHSPQCLQEQQQPKGTPGSEEPSQEQWAIPGEAGSSCCSAPSDFHPSSGAEQEDFPCRVCRKLKWGPRALVLWAQTLPTGVSGLAAPRLFPFPVPGPLSSHPPLSCPFFGAFQSLWSPLVPDLSTPAPLSSTTCTRLLLDSEFSPFEVSTFRLISFSRNFSLSPLVEESHGEPGCEGAAVSLSCI